MELMIDADFEEPNCVKCDNFGEEVSCEKYCGAEHGWFSYRRCIELEGKIEQFFKKDFKIFSL